MAVYTVSSENPGSAFVDLGAGTFSITAAGSSVLYIVPSGTSAEEVLGKATGSCLIGSHQCNISIPAGNVLYVAPQARSIKVYAAAVLSGGAHTKLVQKVWHYDSDLPYNHEASQLSIKGSMPAGNYKFVLKSYTNTNDSNAIFSIRMVTNTIDVNCGVPTTLYGDKWTGTPVDMVFEFFASSSFTSFDVYNTNDALIKPLAYLKLMD